MAYMKRFLEDVAAGMGLDPMDQRALDAANRRLGTQGIDRPPSDEPERGGSSQQLPQQDPA